jgi:hypothetical protein
MRLSRIITAVAVGVAVIGVPSAAGAAQPFTPQPPLPTESQQSPLPSPPTEPQQPSYPPQGPALTATDLTVVVGGPTTLIGTGFRPGELVRLTFTLVSTPTPVPTTTDGGNGDGNTAQPTDPAVLPPITVRADSGGAFRRTVRFPVTGDIRVVARGLRSGRTASAVVTVTGTQPSGLPGQDGGQPPLPVTGGSSVAGTQPSGLPGQDGGQPPLPVTGGSIVPQLGIGAAAVLSGSSMLVAGVLWRRRRFAAALPGSSR